MSRSWQQPAAIAPGLLLLLAVTLAAYLPALGAGFVWDDDDYVTENPALEDLRGLARIWLEPGATPQYYPLVFSSFWIERSLWGLEPFGYHLVNVLLHAGAAALLWRLLVALGIPGAWLAAAVFALHPVHVESVAWVTERKNVLSGLFYLAAARAYLGFEPPDGSGPRRWGAWAAAGVLFAAALASKSVTATLPAALLVVYWWRRGRLGARLVAPLLPFFALGAAAGLFTARLERLHVGAAGAEWALAPLERLLVAARALAFYAGKLLWPHRLSFVYPRWEIDAGEAWQLGIAAAVAAVFAGLFLARGRLGRAPLAGALFFAGTLFPALGFLDVYPHRFSWVADHFQYLASLGLLVPLAAAAARGLERLPRPAARGAVAVLLALLGGLTWRHAGNFRDAETLWRHALERNPEAYLAHSNLGTLLYGRGEAGPARRHYEEALRILPDDPVALNNLAWLLATAADDDLRDGDRAVALAERAAGATGYAVAGILDTLAAARAERGEFADAIAVARRARALAEAAGDAATAAELDRRLARYRAGRPHRVPGP